MRAYIPDYHLLAPKTLEDALSRVAGEPGKWRIFAGGTDLMVLLEAGKLSHRNFLSVWKLPELRGISIASTAVTLGALTTYRRAARSRGAAGFPATRSGGSRDGRRGNPKSRHAGRKHRQCLARRGFAAGAPGV